MGNSINSSVLSDSENTLIFNTSAEVDPEFSNSEATGNAFPSDQRSEAAKDPVLANLSAKTSSESTSEKGTSSSAMEKPTSSSSAKQVANKAPLSDTSARMDVTSNSNSITSSSVLLSGSLLSSALSLQGTDASQASGLEFLRSSSLSSVGSIVTTLMSSQSPLNPGGITKTNPFFWGHNTLGGLFDIGDGIGGESVKELMEKYPYLPIFIIYSILIARGDEATTERFVEAIKSQQKRQAAITYETIMQMKSRQEQNEDLAQEDWKALVGTDRTGAARKDDPPNKCAKILIACAMTVFVIVTYGVGALVLVAMYLVVSMIGMIVNACCSDPAKKRDINNALSYLNFVEVYSDAIVAVVCEIGGYSETDEAMQKLKMGLKIAGDLLMAIIMIAIAVAISVSTAGAGAGVSVAIIAQITAAIASGIVSIAAGVKSIIDGKKALDRAEKKLALNKLIAFLEKTKLDLQVISQDIDILIELFSSRMSDVRSEYDKASRMLKEYNDTKQTIARNLKA